MSDDDWPQDSVETRRAAIRKTIRPASWQELAELGEKRFPVVSDPWCIRYQEFLNTHRNARFHRAEAPGGVEVLYCREADAGVWFLPGSGMGIIQPNGLKILAEIVDALH